MLAIFKKELKSYFRRGYSIIFLAMSALFTGIMVFLYTLYSGYPKTEILLPGLSILFSLSLPILSKNIFSRDRLERTDRLLYSLPFKSSDIVFGKYAALLCFFAIEGALLIILPIIIGLFATVNYALAYLAIISFLLFGAMILALCTMFATSTKSSLMTVIFSYLSILASFLLYLVPVGGKSGLWRTAAGALRFLSPFSHLDNLLMGRVNIASFVYFVLFVALFLFISVCSVNKARAINNYGKKSRETKQFKLSAAFALILCVCTIAVNCLVAIVPTRFSTFDLTSEKVLSINKTTKEYIKALDTNVTIYVLDADSSNKTFEALLAQYDEYSSAITVKYVSPYDIQGLLKMLGWDGYSALESYTLILESGKERYDVILPSSLYYYENSRFGTLSQSDYSQYLSTLYQYAASNSEYQSALESLLYDKKMYYNAEQILNSSIEYLTIDIIPAPYYITGHGEPDSNNSAVLYTYSYEGFPIEILDLSQCTALPEDASSLIINTPTSDLTDTETTMLLDFLKNGGALTLITNEANLDMPNLMSLMSTYGLSANKGFVSYDYEAEAETETETETEAETEAEAEAETTTEDAEATEDTENTEAEEIVEQLPDKNLVTAEINLTHDAFYLFEGYYATLFRANEIVVSPDLRETAKATAILSTDEKCFIDGVENSTGSKTVAVMVEEGDTVVSWFTGADSFDGENFDMVNAYITLYSVAWGVDNYVSEIETVNPRLVSQESLTMASGARLALIAIVIVVIPAAIAVVATVAIKKYMKAPKKDPEY